MPAEKPTRSYPAARKFALRTDATVESGQKEIERVFKLPRGSVRFVLPSGRRARSDKSIEALLRDWNR
jgi:hypothetical protein